jgi:hypothetical protein
VPEQSDLDARAARRNYLILVGSATLVMAGIVVATIQFT